MALRVKEISAIPGNAAIAGPFFDSFFVVVSFEGTIVARSKSNGEA